MSISLESCVGAVRIIIYDVFGRSQRPSWRLEYPSWRFRRPFCRLLGASLGLGGYLGDLRVDVGRSWLGKPTKLSLFWYLRGFVANKFCRDGSICWEVLANSGKCWEAQRHAGSPLDFVRSLKNWTEFDTMVQHVGFNCFAHSGGPGIMVQASIGRVVVVKAPEVAPRRPQHCPNVYATYSYSYTSS